MNPKCAEFAPARRASRRPQMVEQPPDCEVLARAWGWVRAVSWAAAMALCLPCATTGMADDAGAAGGMQVRINIPVTADYPTDSHAGERLVEQMSEIFRTLGYGGKLYRIDDPGQRNPDMPLLMLNLTSWSKDADGNAICKFTAKLATTEVTLPLGMIVGKSTAPADGAGKFGGERVLEDAADAALHNLYAAVAKTGNVPGLRQQ